jgi:hypothetical protein
VKNTDLEHDPAARRAMKEETVRVEFAIQAGSLASAVGTNQYAAADALITGSTGDRWCVSRERFDAKYLPVPPAVAGKDGLYRNRPSHVLAKHMDAPFTVTRADSGDILHGEAGDWLVQYGPGDHGIVERTRFAAVYRLLGSR